MRPVLEAHLVTGEPWWGTQVREDERIPGGHSVGLSKTRVGQQRFREAMLGRYGEACAFTGPQPNTTDLSSAGSTNAVTWHFAWFG
jgi:hypothetical protein